MIVIVLKWIYSLLSVVFKLFIKIVLGLHGLIVSILVYYCSYLSCWGYGYDTLLPC